MDASNRLLEAAQEIQRFCRSRSWRFCFIGGIAVQRWGEARLTRDADLTVYTGIGDELRYIDELLGAFNSRIEGAREFALGHRVLLLRASNGIPLDVTLGALPFEDKAIASASAEEIVAGVRLQLAPPGALVVFKVFADRPQDWLDVEGIIVKSGRLIDWNEVRADLAALLELKGDTTALGRLDELLARLSAP
ncbi:MAG: hypothetical protein ACMG6H_05855 [Acidobacteriota bacterium]